MSNCFVISSFSSVLITLVALFLTHGELWDKIFFHDSLDTGMDFFHSIEYTRGRAPYELFGTLYPPLANLLFYFLFRFTPFWQANEWSTTFSGGIQARGTYIDLRVWQPTMMMFMLFIMLSAALLILLIRRIIRQEKYADWLGLGILLSYGFLFAIERGNIIVLCIICS